MQSNYIRKFLGLVFCGVLSCPAFSQDEPPDKMPNINDVFPEFLKKFLADSFYIGENYTHEEREINDDIKGGAVKRKDEKLYLVKKQNPDLYRKLIFADGEVVADSKFEIKRPLFRFDASFFERYILAINREELLEGVECWVVSLKPRAGFPEKEAKDRALNNLIGELWIERETLLFKQLEVRLAKEVQYAWPGFTGGKAKKAKCVIRAITLEGHFAISYFCLDYEYSARRFFYPVDSHKIKTINYQKYERRTK